MKQKERKLVKHKRAQIYQISEDMFIWKVTQRKKKHGEQHHLQSTGQISAVYLHFNHDKRQSKSEPTQVISCDGEPNVTTKGITGDNSQA